jgi:hypothetical protein
LLESCPELRAAGGEEMDEEFGNFSDFEHQRPDTSLFGMKKARYRV